MMTLDSIQTITTPHKEYSEGPIFFKRKGIYYYLYTIGGDEKYQYAYIMSRVSPLGPFEFPQNDIITTTDYERGVFGPGHGCVFNLEGTDNYYMAYLEFGRRSTNRQTYVNKLEFNADGPYGQYRLPWMEWAPCVKSSVVPPLFRIRFMLPAYVTSFTKTDEG